MGGILHREKISLNMHFRKIGMKLKLEEVACRHLSELELLGEHLKREQTPQRAASVQAAHGSCFARTAGKVFALRGVSIFYAGIVW